MCFSPQATDTMQGCSVFVFSWYRFVFCFLRNVLDKRGQRGGRRARRRHSHHQRWGQPCTRRRKERILHLDCRGSCAALFFPFSLFQSLYLFFSVSVSPFSPPPLTTAPAVSTRNPQAIHRQRSSPSVFLLLPFVYHLHLVHYIVFFFFFFFGSRFSQAACRRCRSYPLFDIFPHLWHECLEVCISTMTASYMSPSLSSLLFPL